MQKNDSNQSKLNYLSFKSNKIINILLLQNVIELKDKETEHLKRELSKLQNEVAYKNNELDKLQSSMNQEKISLSAKQEHIIDQWKEKYEKVILYLN